jgi:hypothetical protein
LERSEKELCHALGDAFNRDDLEMLLDTELNQRLDDIAPASLVHKTVVYRVVRTAKSYGWLDKLIAVALADRPDNGELKEWARRHHSATRLQSGGAASSMPRWQLLDSMYFDLKPIRAAIRQAIRAPSGAVLGFGVTYPDSVFVDKLSDLISSSLDGDTQCKAPLNLKPELDKVSRKVRQVCGYRQDLDSAHVLCVVLVGAVPAGHIADFWRQVRLEFGAAARHCVMLFCGDESTEFPPGVTVLPPPRFDLDDVEQWAEDTVMRFKWPPALAGAWTELLRAYALQDGELDVRMLYDEMDRTIKEIHFDADRFRMKLEDRTWHAISASG